jgi:hypothetical protein
MSTSRNEMARTMSLVARERKPIYGELAKLAHARLTICKTIATSRLQTYFAFVDSQKTIYHPQICPSEGKPGSLSITKKKT